MRKAFILFCLGAWAAVSAAQQSLPTPPCTTGRWVQVALPGTACVAVSEKYRLAVFGHTGFPDNVLTVLPLDATGAVEPVPASRIVPEKPESLKAFTLSMPAAVFHPALPLLYVWRDVAYPFPSSGKAVNPVFRDFDHLAVYAVTNRTLALVGTYARGPAYEYGLQAGSLAVDPQGRRLFVPNIRDPRSGRCAVGYLPLTEAGLPLATEDAAAPASVDIAQFETFPAGKGWAVFNERVAITAGINGLLLWDTGNRLAFLSRVLLREWPGLSVAVGGHPAIPAAYFACTPRVGMIETAEGYPTLLPRDKVVPDAVFTSPPVVQPGAPAGLAVGGVNAVYWIGIDKTSGRFDGRDSVIVVTNKAVRALASAPAWNRLYIPVEALP